MSTNISFGDETPQVLSFAGRALRRIIAGGGRGVTFEDVVQECAVAWCIARDRWNAECGVPFGAYLINGVHHHINAWLRKEFKETNVAPFSLDAPADEDEDSAGICHQTHADQGMLAEQLVIENDVRAKVMARLSKSAAQFVTMLENPPAELLDEVRAIQSRAAFGRSRGINVAAPKRLTSQLIFDLMGCTRPERTMILKEISAVAEKVNQK